MIPARLPHTRGGSSQKAYMPLSQVRKRLGTSQFEVYERVGKSIISVILVGLKLKYFEQMHLMTTSFHLLLKMTRYSEFPSHFP